MGSGADTRTKDAAHARRRRARRLAVLPAVLAGTLVLGTWGGVLAPASLGLPALAAIRPPAPTSGATRTLPPGAGLAGGFPVQVPVVVETDDATGDVAWHPAGSAIRPPASPPAIDITHLAAWSARGALHVEVTLAGRAPVPGDPATLVRLSVGHAGSWREAPVCTSAALCAAPADTLPFTWSVTQRAGGWEVEYALPWSEIAWRLGAVSQSRDGYEVLVSASAIGLDAVWVDRAPEDHALTVMPGSPATTLQEA